MHQYFSGNIRKEICSLITYQRLCQTVIAYSEKRQYKKEKKKIMAAEPLLSSWRAKPSIDPSGSEDTVTSPLHLSVILSSSNDLAVRSGKSGSVWCFFVSNVQLFSMLVPAKYQSVPCGLRFNAKKKKKCENVIKLCIMHDSWLKSTVSVVRHPFPSLI